MNEASNAVVVDTRRSPHAVVHPVPLTSVVLSDAFWEPRRRINRDTTLPAQHRLCEETGRIDNFRRAAGKKSVPFVGIFFNDSDVYKWLEAAAWSLATNPDPALKSLVDDVVNEIADAQQPDGYLNTYFLFERAGERWSNLQDMHELYCAGHLFQAAVAHHRATGDRRLFDVAARFADYIGSVFGTGEGQRQGACGHEEIEMALVELARDTGNGSYLDLARFFVDIRGYGHIGGSPYHQDHVPFREMREVVGHAVRQVYLNCGAADIAAETGETALRSALDRLWDNMVRRRSYVSGGIGSRWEGEAFGKDFELPNARAYTETCAAIGSVMWNWRMLAFEGDARYADAMEWTLYNAVLPGLSLDGQSYFYQNPLSDEGTHRRQAWFGCACCPPNVARLLASLPGYVYGVSDDAAWIHLYAAGRAELPLPDGRTIRLSVATDYPWDGAVHITVDGAGDFALCLRVPAWCEAGAAIEVNGTPITEPIVPGTYTRIERAWSAGDQVQMTLPMPVRLVECHPSVAENAGRVAIARGPLLYCVEQADLGGASPADIVVPDDAVFTPIRRPDLLGGVTVLQFDALTAPADADWADRLYRTVRTSDTVAAPIPVSAVPYYAWANRAPGPMRVWFQFREAAG